VIPRSGLILAGALLGAGTALVAQTDAYRSPRETLPLSVEPQPVAFSHRMHAGEAELECVLCHTGVDQGDFAEIVQAGECMVCHEQIAADSPEVKKVKVAAESREPIPWVPVYRVPDIVFFSHKEHLAAGEECATCHGPVETRDVLQKEVSTNMTACLDCHRERGAPVGCTLCHVLGH
jgi:hypothetical protein